MSEELSQFENKYLVCYLAGRQGSSTVDVSVKVKGGFRYAAAAQTQKCRGSDEELHFSLLTTRAQTSHAHAHAHISVLVVGEERAGSEMQ